MCFSCRHPQHLFVGGIGADYFSSYADANAIRGCPTCKSKFSAEFNIPDIWWREYNRRANGYFGSQDVLDSAQRIIGHGKRAQHHASLEE